jgi:isoleucyl-tRNA synthetase
LEPSWRDHQVSLRWQDIRAWRKIATENIEPLRREKVIGSSLEAEVEIGFPADPYDREVARLQTINLAEIFIVSKATAYISNGDDFEVRIIKTDNHKCGRCWRLLPEVETDGDLCARCSEVVEAD